MFDKKWFIVAMCFAVHSAGSTAAEPRLRQSSDARAIAQGDVLDNDLKPQETHTFRVALRAGDYLETELTERGINVILAFYDPAGMRVAEENSGNGNFDTSRFQTLAPVAGDFRFELKGISSGQGKYRLRVTMIRPATEADQKNVQAHRLEREAINLDQQGTPAARRQALEKQLEVLTHRQAAADRPGEAKARADIGRLHFYLDDRPKALEYLQRALELYRALNDQTNAAFILNNLGAVHQEMGEPDKALDYYMQSLPGLRAMGDKYREAVAVHNLGWCYQTLGEFKQASEFYREALPLWRIGGNAFGEAQTLNNLGLTYRHLGDLERSLQYFEQALELRRTLKDGRGEAQTLGNLARIYFEGANWQKSEDFFRQSLRVARQVEDKTTQASALMGLATLAPITPLDEALEYANEALALSDAVQDSRSRADALFTLAKVHHERGDDDLAIEKYKEALQLQIAFADPRAEAHTALALGRLVGTKDLPQGRVWMEQGLDLIESLRGRVPDPDLRTSFLASVQDYYRDYVDLLMRMHEREPAAGYAELALHASERARARGLLDALAEQPAQIRQGVEPALLEMERKLQVAVNTKDQQWRQLVSFKKEPEASAAQRELARLLDELSQVKGEIRARSPRYANLVQPQPASLKELQRQLDKDSLLLEYWLGNDRSFLWAITADSMKTYTLPGRAAIEESARQFFSALTNRSADLSRIADGLSETLLGAVAGSLDKKTLVVVSHDALQYVPFAALPMPRSASSTGSAAPLLDRHEIVSLPSASVLGPLRTETAKRKSPDKLVAILADPVFSREDPRFPQVAGPATAQASLRSGTEELQRAAEGAGLDGLRRLRFSRVEADAIASLVPAGNRFQAVDFRASRDTALSPELGNYRILHFATHGLLNSSHPELSGLVFSTVDAKGNSQDGLLRLHEIFNLSLNADLVVLSACQTALGKDIQGEGLIGLTRGFMYAGAPRVVASLWNVEDRATAELMKRFYEGILKRQLKPVAALREAQLALQRDKRWASPYYWAGFMLQGDWQ
jgi:CHAT domain-containing protein/Tfp pilus assembly protein PilF